MKKFFVLILSLFSLQTFGNDQLRSELNQLMFQHNEKVQGMNQLLWHELPQRQSIEQQLFVRQQYINRLMYLQNVLNGPLYPIQRQQAGFEYQQVQMMLANGDVVLNQFIQNYYSMYDLFWKFSREAGVLQGQIQLKQQELSKAIEKQKEKEASPERLAKLEQEKTKLEEGKTKLLNLAKEAEATAKRAKELQTQSGTLVDELSETLNWND